MAPELACASVDLPIQAGVFDVDRQIPCPFHDLGSGHGMGSEDAVQAAIASHSKNSETSGGSMPDALGTFPHAARNLLAALTAAEGVAAVGGSRLGWACAAVPEVDASDGAGVRDRSRFLSAPFLNCDSGSAPGILLESRLGRRFCGLGWCNRSRLAPASYASGTGGPKCRLLLALPRVFFFFSFVFLFLRALPLLRGPP